MGLKGFYGVLCGRYQGCHMDALQKRTESLWTVTWLPHGCFVGNNGVSHKDESLRKHGNSKTKLRITRKNAVKAALPA